MSALISVIVLNWNGGAHLRACLDSLLLQDYASTEVIVVDNGSTDDSPDMVREHYQSVRLIDNKANLGFAAGNNVGIREAKGDYVVILNNDAELEADCLSRMRGP